MLDLCLALLAGGSLGIVQELQQLALYFQLHAWLGVFFSLQLAGLLVVKARADGYNALGALGHVPSRRAAGAARGILGLRRAAPRARWCEAMCFVVELILA